MSLFAARRSNNIAHFQTLFAVVSLVALVASLPLRQRPTRQVIIIPEAYTAIENYTATCDALRDERKDNSGSVELELEMAVARDFYEANGYLLYDLVKKAYEPTCLSGSHESHIFTPIQCFSAIWDSEQYVFCWCADPNTGKPQNVSQPLIERHMTNPAECEPSKSCEHNNEIIEHGQQISEPCLTCTCYNGVLSGCNDEMCLPNGNMTTLQFYNFRVNLLRKMLVDYAHRDSGSAPDYEVLLSQISPKSALDNSEATIGWKFEQMDENNRGEYVTMLEVFRYFAVEDVRYFYSTTSLIVKISEIIDLDKSNTVTMEEWREFFNLENESYLVAINALDLSGSGSGFGK